MILPNAASEHTSSGRHLQTSTRQCFWLYTALNKILAFAFTLLPWEIWLWPPEIPLLGILVPYAGWQLGSIHYAPELPPGNYRTYGRSTRMVATRITGPSILGTIVDKNLLF